MNLKIVPGILVCISLLNSVCVFIVSKALLMSSATVIVRAGGAIWAYKVHREQRNWKNLSA